METITEVRCVDIQFSGLQYCYIINNSLFWASDGYYNKTVIANGIEKDKEFFSSETGSMSLTFIQSQLVLFDSSTNEFHVSFYFLGNSISFKTKSHDEAHDLYNKVHSQRYGFYLPDINSLADLPGVVSFSGNDSLDGKKSASNVNSSGEQ